MRSSDVRARRGKALSPIAAQRIDDAANSFMEQPVAFKLQLRPLAEPDSFKPSVQLVSREFATRYLEAVGVRPSKATMDLVHRNMPLTESHIKTTLRAKGHVEDEIHIIVPPVTHHYRVPVVINPAAVLQLGIGNSVLGAEAATSPDQQGPEAALSSTATSHARIPDSSKLGSTGELQVVGTVDGLGRSQQGGTMFLDMAARYLHPFNMDLSLARQNLTALYSAARHSASGNEPDNSTTDPYATSGYFTGGVGTGTGGSVRVQRSGGMTEGHSAVSSLASVGGTDGRRWGSWPRSSSNRPQMPRQQQPHTYDAARAEVAEELSQALLVTPEVVLTLQAQLEAALADWHRHQAPEALKGRLTPEEFQRTLEELSSEGMVKLLITLVNFLHEELIKEHLAYPGQDIRLNSREGLRSSQGRGFESLLGERNSLPHGSSTCSDNLGGGSSRRSIAGTAGHRGNVQGPSSLSIQQMTNLQKYDLGYQAYVRQKLEQRHNPVYTTPPVSTSRPQRRPSVSAGPAVNAGSDRAHPQGLSDTQRVSFAIAPQYSSSPTSPQSSSRPESPTARNTSTNLFGSLNLPGANRSRPPSSTQVMPPPSPGEYSLTSSPIPGLPPRVGRALRHSSSFALASAASTARTIHASLDAEDVAALQRERLFALHVDFASRFKALRQSRSGMFFTLPILLLSMRLCVNMLFSTLYPLWMRLPEGAQVLEDMDAALCALFDPHGYLARALSLLQSTPSAIEAVTRHPQRRGHERQHFNDTSPLLQATLQGAKSPGARKLVRSPANQPEGRGLLRTQLTPEQRAMLFQLGLQWMQQTDPVLSQVGEPQAVGRL